MPSGDGGKQEIRDSFYEIEIFVENEIACQSLEDGEWDVAYEYYGKDRGQKDGTDGSCNDLFHVVLRFVIYHLYGL